MANNTTYTDRNTTPSSTSTTVNTNRLSLSATSTAIVLFEDNFDSVVTASLDTHTPDVGSSWSDALGGGIDIIANSSFVRCIGEHDGGAGSTTTAVEGAVRYNTSEFSATNFDSSDINYDIIAQFTGGDSTTPGAIVFWGVGGGKQSSDDVDNGWVFSWLTNNVGWELIEQNSSVTVTAGQSWPGNDTYIKLELRSSGARGLYSTDGETYNPVLQLDSTWQSTAGLRGQLYYGNFTNQADPADCRYFKVQTT